MMASYREDSILQEDFHKCYGGAQEPALKWISYLAFAACLEGLVFAFLMYRMRPPNRMIRLLAVIGLINAWWTGCEAVVYGADTSGVAMAAYRWSYLGILSINIFNTALFLEVAGVKIVYQRFVMLFSFIVVVAVGTGYLIAGFPWSDVAVEPGGNRGIAGPSNFWSQLSDVVFIGLDLGSIVVLVTSWFRERSRKRRYLIGFTLWSIAILVPVYLGLSFVADAWRAPLLEFVPGNVLLAILIFVIRRWRLFVDPLLTFSKILPTALSVPVLLVDLDETVIGANAPARKRLSGKGSLLTGRPAAQLLDQQTLDRSQRSPHFDQFGDPVGTVIVLPQPQEEEPWPADLSARETDVLLLAKQGLSNLEIADQLFISEGTVKSHVHRILRQTRSSSREDLVRRWGRPQP